MIIFSHHSPHKIILIIIFIYNNSSSQVSPSPHSLSMPLYSLKSDHIFMKYISNFFRK
jgi:hypothetical protein